MRFLEMEEWAMVSHYGIIHITLPKIENLSW